MEKILLQLTQLIRLVLFTAFSLLFIACGEKSHKTLNGEKLIHEKCVSCHNLDLPPKSYENEKAPPMMAVSFHIIGFIQATRESDKVPNAIEFVKDYVLYPSAEKSFCDKESLKTYGLMPSQKDKVSEAELEAIARYMFEHFTQQNLDQAQQLQNRLNAMPKGERIALQNNCLTCHRKDKDLVGPSFSHIAKRYGDSPQIIAQSIYEGSKAKWKSSHGAVMPKFDKLNKEDIKILTNWILKQK